MNNEDMTTEVGKVELTAQDFRVVARYAAERAQEVHLTLYPKQPRPRSRNKKDMEAWRAQFDYPDYAGR
jgi:hypothetical protein